jgi:serine/threonine protein kinase
MSIPPFSQDFLNKYGLLRTLGEGSYGVVLLAKNKFLDKFVAIKALKELHADEALRFSRESKILASLEHPNIVRVFDAGVDGQIPYMTMEVVEGDTLDKVLESNPPDLKRSLEIIAQCGDAVAFAHERGIIHRDLKPQNCFQLRDGSIKLGDFGLAREIAGGNTITASSVLLGTPHYISVEQVRGERAGPASDQYALAVMAYQMVTGGRLPFEGDNLMAVITARITETPAPPSDHKPGLPPDVDAWIMKGLARAPENRFASVTEFVVEARRIIEPKKVITGAAVRTSGRISRPQTTTPGGVPGETMPAGAAPSAPGRVSAKSRPVQPRSSGQVSGSFNSVAAPLPTPLWRKLVAAGMVIAALALGVQGWSRRSLDRAVVTEGSPASATPTALPALDERVSELAKRLSHRAAQVDPEAIYRLLPIKGDLTSTLQQRNVTKEDQDRYVRQVLGFGTTQAAT